MHTVSIANLRDGSQLPWEDPAGLATMSDGKRRALLANPCRQIDDEPAQFLATSGSRVIGRLDQISGELWVDGAPRRMSWTSNILVDPLVRRQGVGRKLFERQRQTFACAAGYSYTPASLSVARKAGFIFLRLPRLIFPRKSASIMGRFVRPRRVAEAISFILDMPRKLMPGVASALGHRRSATLHIQHLASVPTELDPYLARHTQPLAALRSSAWINWVLTSDFSDAHESPDHFRRKAYLIEGYAGDPVGYFLLKVRRYSSTPGHGLANCCVGHLVDWIIFDSNALSESDLVLTAIQYLWVEDPDLIVVYPEERRTAALLVGLGFLPYGALDFGFAPGNEPWRGPEFANRNCWRLRPAEGDNMFN